LRSYRLYAENGGIKSVKRFTVYKYRTIVSQYLLVRGIQLLLSVSNKRAKRTAGVADRPTR